MAKVCWRFQIDCQRGYLSLTLTGIFFMSDDLLRLYPDPGPFVALRGLYLNSGLRECADTGPLVYTNFIVSIDGRIALAQPDGHHQIPGDITNRRDWRLFQELAALSDVLITSGRYLRDVAHNKAQDVLPVSRDADYDDLRAFRRDRGLSDQPAVAIVSGSLDIDVQTLPTDQRDVVIITTAHSGIARRRALEARGARVIVAGDGNRVGGDQLVAALAAMNYRLMYSIAGSMLCHTLIAAGQLHRLYITQAHRLLGGDDFDTIVRGSHFVPPRDLKLKSLYYDATALEGAGQCYALYQID